MISYKKALSSTMLDRAFSWEGKRLYLLLPTTNSLFTISVILM